MSIEPFVRKSEQVLELSTWNNLSADMLVAGFTTRVGGISSTDYESFNLGLHVKDNPNTVGSNRNLLGTLLDFPTSRWVCSEQTHDNKIVKVSSSDIGAGVYDYSNSIKDTDGLYTDDKNILLTLCYADCVPLFFYSPDRQLIGIAHAGWKGTVKNIAGEMVQKWREEGVLPHQIFAAIGPAIGKCCYVVDDYVINLVRDLEIESANIFSNKEDGQYQLDLKQLNYELLKKAGIRENHISVSSYCTSCENNLFFSHRKDNGKTGRMMSFIGIKEV
ncbi:peptidoglycan editing factor PgeF [Fredinandcohnia sp. 179-A 10B2 NHS]|uniref:peptidoglycan editing factor PgeF n=1 Tax=Fredinandcohnia sp. 179-A 10B2 NHS TaxID=3235176 RepID=UPI0039A2A9B4